LGRLTFEHDNSIVSHYRGYPTLIADKVIVCDDWRRKGLGLTLYLTLIYNGFSIVSSGVQYDNARRLWRSLSQNFNGVYVDVYDVKKNKTLKTHHIIKDVDLDNLDNEFALYDPNISLHDQDRINIRFIAYLEK
jgi:hypothetical protein